MLAHVFEHLRASGLNVQESENIVFEGAEAAVARINLDALPPDRVVQAIRSGNADIIDLSIVPL